MFLMILPDSFNKRTTYSVIRLFRWSLGAFHETTADWDLIMLTHGFSGMSAKTNNIKTKRTIMDTLLKRFQKLEPNFPNS